jgi:hypothetical protein
MELSKWQESLKMEVLPHKNLLKWSYVNLFLSFGLFILIGLNHYELFLGLPYHFYASAFFILIALYLFYTPQTKELSYQNKSFDIIIFFTCNFILTQFDKSIQAFLVSFLSLILIFGFSKITSFYKLKTYSLFFYILSIIWTGLWASFHTTGHAQWDLWSSLWGLLSLCLLGATSFMLWKTRSLSLESGGKVQQYCHTLSQKNLLFLTFAPVFITIACFFFWRFEKGYLTLIWVLEIFILVALSLWIRQKKMMHIAFSLMGLCVLRLLFFDLAQSDLSTRALVFIGVGILMILMYSLYTRFKERFL